MKRRSCRSFELRDRGALRSVPLFVLVAAVGCGFGLYDDSGALQVTGANDGVPDAGMWWPWMCPNGSNPTPPTTPTSYAVSGTCSDGGTLTLSANGCDIEGNWAVLSLSAVSTDIPSSLPAAGGWEVSGTRGPAVPDGGVPCTCDATASSSGALLLTCTVPDGGATECVTTLTPLSPVAAP
jgi:hypothetical protein